MLAGGYDMSGRVEKRSKIVYSTSIQHTSPALLDEEHCVFVVPEVLESQLVFLTLLHASPMCLDEADEIFVVLEALDPAEVGTTCCAAAHTRLEKDNLLFLCLEVCETLLVESSLLAS